MRVQLGQITTDTMQKGQKLAATSEGGVTNKSRVLCVTLAHRQGGEQTTEATVLA